MKSVFICLALLLTCLPLFYGCDGENKSPTNYVTLQENDKDTYLVYDTSSPYLSALKSCPFVKYISDSCLLTVLPFIGQESSSVTIDKVMSRVVVSHSWMGDRFKQMLGEMPSDVLLLFKPVTAIVIGADIRPANYKSMTGAIYLDPAYLWMTAEEKNTVSKVDDYRTDYGKSLSFDFLWRYTINNQYAYNVDLLAGEARTPAEVKYPLLRLLYHELAHANDFIPPDMLPNIPLGSTPYRATTWVGTSKISTRSNYLNTSEILKGLARVSFSGYNANDEQKGYQPDFLGEQFETDRASLYYGYLTQYEDIATIFEMLMMHKHFGLEADIGFTNLPPKNSPTSAYIVKWGMRNRIFDSHVKLKALEIYNMMFPEDKSTDYRDRIDQQRPTSLKIDVDWLSNLDPTGATTKNTYASQTSSLKPDYSAQFDRMPPH